MILHNTMTPRAHSLPLLCRSSSRSQRGLGCRTQGRWVGGGGGGFSPGNGIASCHTAIAVRAADVICTHMLCLSAAHEAVAQLQIIDCMLRKQVPPKVFVVARIFLRWVRAGVTNVPNMAWKSMAIHGPADGAVPTISHGWHDLAIKPANAFQLFARDRNTGEREAALVLYPCMQRRRNNRIIIATLDYAKS